MNTERQYTTTKYEMQSTLSPAILALTEQIPAPIMNKIKRIADRLRGERQTLDDLKDRLSEQESRLAVEAQKLRDMAAEIARDRAAVDREMAQLADAANKGVYMKEVVAATQARVEAEHDRAVAAELRAEAERRLAQVTKLRRDSGFGGDTSDSLLDTLL